MPATQSRRGWRPTDVFAVRPEDRAWWRRGGFLSASPSPGMRRILRALRRLYRERLTDRGRFALGALAVFAVLGAEVRRSQVFVLFAVGAGLLLLPALLALLPRPRVRLRTRLPQRLTARTPVALRVAVENTSGRALSDLLVRVRDPDGPVAALTVTPRESYVALGPGDSIEAPITIEAPRRGRYALRSPTAAAVDPLRLLATAPVGGDENATLVYPRFYTIDRFPVAMGRRYQPGGIPLSSNLGDSIEFVGTREYREGDPLRNIHWRSWARRGVRVGDQRVGLDRGPLQPQRVRRRHPRGRAGRLRGERRP
jgi:uncharacterized protein (DUF58 family)